MESVNFEEKNCVFKKEGCKDLNTLKIDKYIISCWEMNKLERKEFLRTGRVFLTCIGEQPPVMLTVKKPYYLQTENNEKS